MSENVNYIYILYMSQKEIIFLYSVFYNLTIKLTIKNVWYRKVV